MIKQQLGILLLVSIGVIAGVVLSNSRLNQESSSEPSLSAIPSWVAQENEPNTAEPGQDNPARITALETDISRLNERLAALETALSNTTIKDVALLQADGQGNIAASTNEVVPMLEGLVAAGIDQYSAETLARQQSQVQLDRLNLRDAAIRGGYIGSDQYREEIRALREAEVEIKDEIDEDTYDKYLYYTGQPNRLAINSVMLGSAAESSGLKQGDLLIRYEDQKLHTLRDLRSATLEGERNELVDITVLRDGSEVRTSIPRGPLGVQLSSVRVNPE
jgi:hypothetical protein